MIVIEGTVCLQGLLSVQARDNVAMAAMRKLRTFFNTSTELDDAARSTHGGPNGAGSNADTASDAAASCRPVGHGSSADPDADVGAGFDAKAMEGVAEGAQAATEGVAEGVAEGHAAAEGLCVDRVCEMTLEVLEGQIKTLNYYKTKAKNIKACAEALQGYP